jgi:putative endonuclease
MQYVYLIRCNDGKIYTGCTSDLRKRFKAHQDGKVKFTSIRRPLELELYIAFKDEYKAWAFEKYLKSGSGKAFAQKRFLNKLSEIKQ